MVCFLSSAGEKAFHFFCIVKKKEVHTDERVRGIFLEPENLLDHIAHIDMLYSRHASLSYICH